MASHASPTTAQRQPPPSLFLGPPSHNSSRTSLPSLFVPGAHASAVATPAQSRVPLPRNRSSRNAPPTANTPVSPAGIPSSSNNSNPTATIAAAAAAVAATVPPTRHSQSTQHPQPPQPSTRPPTPAHLTRSRTSILWAEMQATLGEVELSASRTTHLFGAAHSSALSRLRASQIALAQAWARSEAVEDTTASLASPSDPHVPNSNDTTNPTEESPTSRTEPSPSSKDPQPSPPPSHSNLEAHTENDVLLARQHREANDLFFQRVNNGVLDVVARLEDVAIAMREVEQESRDIWSDSSDGGESVEEGGGGGAGGAGGAG